MDNDPFDPQPQTFVDGPVYGEVTWTVWDCVLQKGARGGKAPFDQSLHDPRRKLLCITLTITPLDGTSTSQYLPQWDLLRDVGDEWAKFVLPSLKSLGLNTWAEVTGKVKFAKVGRQKTGETYPHRSKTNQDGTPLIIEKTTAQFLAYYPDEAACRKAYEAENPVMAQPAAPAPASNGNGAHAPNPADTALAFIKVWVKRFTANGQKDYDTVAGLLDAEIKKYPNVAAHYSLKSATVAELLIEQGVEIPF